MKTNIFLVVCKYFLHLLEDPGEGASLGGGPPAGDGAHVAGGVLLAAGGQTWANIFPVLENIFILNWCTDGADVLAAEVGWLLQVQHADVVGDGPGVVVLG